MILEYNSILDIFRVVNCRIFLITIARSRNVTPILEGVCVGFIACSYGICRNSDSITKMICLSAYNRTIVILEYNGVIDKGRFILCCEGCVAGTSSERLIPRQKCVGISFVACSFGIGNSCDCIAVMILNRLNNATIPIKELDIVLNVCSLINRRVFSISNTVFCNRLTPVLKGVSIYVIRIACLIFRHNNFSTKIIGFATDDVSVPIFEYYRVFHVGRIKCCRVSLVTQASSYLAIPTCKAICVAFICRLGRRFGDNNCIAVMVSFRTKDATVVILEYDFVINISRAICSCVNHTFGTIRHGLIPTHKCMGVGGIRGSCGIARLCNGLTISIYVTANHITVPILKYYCVFNINRCIGCRVGLISVTSNYFTIPTCEGIGISVISRLGRC